MAATTTSSLSTSTTTPLATPSSTTSSSTTSSPSLPGQESPTSSLTSTSATSASSSEALSTSTSIPTSSSSALSQVTSVVPPSSSPNSSNTVPTSSSTSSTQATLPSPSPNNVSTGALAGAIVGCIIGTAALTILGAFLFLRRRRKGAGAGPLAQFSEEKPPQHPPLGLGASASFPYIPHPADDETVRARILTLFDHASLHVDNYYSSGVAAASNLHDSATPLSSYESPYLPATITTLLAKPGRQRAVLTHVLVRELLQQITPGPAKGKLLPACYASCPQVVDQTPETDHALFSWRMLTAYLYRHQQATRDADEHAIDRLTERFVDTFTGYANSAHTRSERLQHLKSVASAAADLGRWLFAQPCAFEFVWDYAGRQGVVITPRVVKVCDEQGRRLSVPQVMAEGTSL